jgi:hypothetical protein
VRHGRGKLKKVARLSVLFAQSWMRKEDVDVRSVVKGNDNRRVSELGNATQIDFSREVFVYEIPYVSR